MEIFLKGNYKSFTKLFVTKSKKKTNHVLVNVHGLYGLSGDSKSKSRKLAEVVTKKGVTHAVMFNSSRDWDVFEDGNWEKMKKAFLEKTFDQELQDVRDTIELILDQSKELFGVGTGKLKLFLVGNSLGGTLITCLDDYFKYVEKMIIAGSGTRTVFPSKLTEKQIFNKASKFNGKALLLQGGKDDVVPLEAGDTLLSGYKNAKTKKIVLDGLNHQFSKINGTNKRKAYQLYVDVVVGFLGK